MLEPDARFWKQGPGERLQRAAAQCNIAEVRALIDDGAPLNHQNERGESSVFAAAEHAVDGYTQHARVITILAEAGADVNLADRRGSTPLMRAAWYGHASVLQALVDAGADVTRVNELGDTALGNATPKQGATQGHTAARAILEGRVP